MGNTLTAAAHPAPVLAHFAVRRIGHRSYRLIVQCGKVRSEASYSTEGLAKRAALAEYPGAILVPDAWLRTPEQSALVAVRACGAKWGACHARGRKADDAHRTYCREFFAEASSKTPPPGHYEAFAESYVMAYADALAVEREFAARFMSSGVRL